MTSLTNHTRRQKIACLAVGSALTVGGAALALSSASPTATAPLLEFLGLVVSAIAMLGGSVLAMALVRFLVQRFATRFPHLVRPTLVGIAGLVTAILLTVAVPGWLRFLGFEALGRPGLGSVPIGIGGVAFALGAMALSWCLTPVVTNPEGGPPLGGKILAVSVTFLSLVVLPGLIGIAGTLPRDMPPVPMASAGSAQTTGSPSPTN